jgi:putative membrane protein
MSEYGILVLKGWAMGAANVIPGVSGGTIAFITGIYEELIDSIKSFDGQAIKLFFSGKFSEFAKHTNLAFLAAIFLGIGVSVFSLAILLTWLFEAQPIPTMAFFFGLILASIWLVGKQVHQWGAVSIAALLIGSAIAIGIAFLKPAAASTEFFYLFLCGIAAICSMILPGLSGSYILLMMGNYWLILGAAKSPFDPVDSSLAPKVLNGQTGFELLIPVMVGCGVGLILFSHLLNFVLKRYHDQTVAMLTGFVLGSLLIIWPWKNETTIEQMVDGELRAEVIGYSWYMPQVNGDFALAVVAILIGAIAVMGIERMGAGRTSKA